MASFDRAKVEWIRGQFERYGDGLHRDVLAEYVRVLLGCIPLAGKYGEAQARGFPGARCESSYRTTDTNLSYRCTLPEDHAGPHVYDGEAARGSAINQPSDRAFVTATGQRLNSLETRGHKQRQDIDRIVKLGADMEGRLQALDRAVRAIESALAQYGGQLAEGEQRRNIQAAALDLTDHTIREHASAIETLTGRVDLLIMSLRETDARVGAHDTQLKARGFCGRTVNLAPGTSVPCVLVAGHLGSCRG